jgi:acetyltransferase-like isoleucine patch superfamily enzyme
MSLWSLARAKWECRRREREKRRYNPSTYAEYLRRCGAQVGDGCFIAAMDMEVGIEAYLLKIGSRVTIEPEVACLTHDGAAWIFRHLVPDLQVYGPITIEDDCSIGRGAILCPNVRVGRGATVAPGSLVISDIPPGSSVAGVPARSLTPANHRGAA